MKTPFRKGFRKGVIAAESIRFRLLHDDTHRQTARKGDVALGGDGESRSSHGTVGIIR
jgi:hypothetical protein